ncbi:hypothetical protein MKEN_00403900 [Mycena kentingensis (nom. inval.)]|nr:hypothetical protein MKEN_00403900 [Mycena kentingensis (nom. inval.)]
MPYMPMPSSFSTPTSPRDFLSFDEKEFLNSLRRRALDTRSNFTNAPAREAFLVNSAESLLMLQRGLLSFATEKPVRDAAQTLLDELNHVASNLPAADKARSGLRNLLMAARTHPAYDPTDSDYDSDIEMDPTNSTVDAAMSDDGTVPIHPLLLTMVDDADTTVPHSCAELTATEINEPTEVSAVVAALRSVESSPDLEYFSSTPEPSSPVARGTINTELEGEIFSLLQPRRPTPTVDLLGPLPVPSVSSDELPLVDNVPRNACAVPAAHRVRPNLVVYTGNESLTTRVQPPPGSLLRRPTLPFILNPTPTRNVSASSSTAVVIDADPTLMPERERGLSVLAAAASSFDTGPDSPVAASIDAQEPEVIDQELMENDEESEDDATAFSSAAASDSSSDPDVLDGYDVSNGLLEPREELAQRVLLEQARIAAAKAALSVAEADVDVAFARVSAARARLYEARTILGPGDEHPHIAAAIATLAVTEADADVAMKRVVRAERRVVSAEADAKFEEYLFHMRKSAEDHERARRRALPNNPAPRILRPIGRPATPRQTVRRAPRF